MNAHATRVADQEWIFPLLVRLTKHDLSFVALAHCAWRMFSPFLFLQGEFLMHT